MRTPSRIQLAVAFAIALLALPAVAGARPAAQLKPSAPRAQLADSVASVVVGAAKVSVAKNRGAIEVTLNGVRPRVVLNMVKSRYRSDGRLKFTPFKRSLVPLALIQRWERHVGIGASVHLRDGTGEATLYDVLKQPVWNSRTRAITLVVGSNRSNNQNATKARKLGPDVMVLLTPQPAVPRSDAARGIVRPSSRQAALNDACLGSEAASAGNDFCLQYSAALGSGGASWVNILSGTQQPTTTCQVQPVANQIGGAAVVAGNVFVEGAAKSAQQSLSTSASVGYKSKVMSGSAKAAFGKSSQTDASSVYAIAEVTVNGGAVNFGAPQLTASRQSQAESIDTFSEALGFMQSCGDSVPAYYTVGATWISVLQMKTADTTSATNLSASLGASYKGTSAAANFSGAVESSTSTESITETDFCQGPANCFSVPNYVAPAAASTDIDSALSAFTNTYSLMLANLANSCQPGANDASCITQVSYVPITDILPGGDANSPSSLVAQASQAVYAVQSNFNDWSTGYQGLLTAFPTDPQAAKWSSALSSLTTTAPYCGVQGLQSQQMCATNFQNCSDWIENYLNYAGAPCLPSAFTANNLQSVTDPDTISAPTTGAS